MLHNTLDFARFRGSIRITGMLNQKHTIARKLATGALSVTLAASCSLLVPAAAWGDEVEAAQNSLAAAEQQMSQIVAEYDELEQDIAESQQQIDETTGQAMEAQQAMLEGREVVGKVMANEYTNDTLGEMFTLVFQAESFNDFLRRLDYANDVMTAAAEEVQAQKERKAAYEGILGELNTQRDEQQSRLDQLDDKKQEAQRVVDQANASLVNAKAEEAARLQALAEQAAALQAQQEAEQQAAVSEEWDTASRDEAAEQQPAAEAEQQQQPAQTESAPADSGSNASGGESASNGGSSNSGASNNGGSSGSTVTDSSTGWQTGVASAYGGSSDPNTPNPGTTATGALCDDNSMGVAIPMSWPNYSSYLGRSVEISYGGMTIVATVNDCGYMGGGSRSLDLQPGVFKAFGFNTCQAWGVRTVSYRFL